MFVHPASHSLPPPLHYYCSEWVRKRRGNINRKWCPSKVEEEESYRLRQSSSMARLSTNPNDFCFADIPLTRMMRWAMEPTYLASAANNPQLCLKRRTEGGRTDDSGSHSLGTCSNSCRCGQLFPWNKQKREFHANTFAFAGIPSSPAIFGSAASNTIRSLGGELLLTLRQQTRNHHHLLREDHLVALPAAWRL